MCQGEQQREITENKLSDSKNKEEKTRIPCIVPGRGPVAFRIAVKMSIAVSPVNGWIESYFDKNKKHH